MFGGGCHWELSWHGDAGVVAGGRQTGIMAASHSLVCCRKLFGRDEVWRVPGRIICVGRDGGLREEKGGKLEVESERESGQKRGGAWWMPCRTVHFFIHYSVCLEGPLRA